MSGPGYFHPLGPAVIERAVDAASADRRLAGLMLGGSSLTGETDEFSDLDLVIATRDVDHGTALADAAEFAARLGPLLVCFTGEHVGEPRLLICLYGPPLLHVDLKFVALSDLASRVEDPIVLWEREPGLLGSATAAAAGVALAAAAMDRRSLLGVGPLHRGEDRPRRALRIPGCARGDPPDGPRPDARAGRRPRPRRGARRIEQLVGEHSPPTLEATVGDLGATGCVGALRASADLYRALRDHLDDGSLRRHAEAERLSLAYLDEL